MWKQPGSFLRYIELNISVISISWIYKCVIWNGFPRSSHIIILFDVQTFDKLNNIIISSTLNTCMYVHATLKFKISVYCLVTHNSN